MVACVVSAMVNRGRKSNGYISSSIPSIYSTIGTWQQNTTLVSQEIQFITSIHFRKEKNDYILKSDYILKKKITSPNREIDHEKKRKKKKQKLLCI